MKQRRHTPEQIIRKLREADRLLAEGREIAEVAKHLEISEATYHRWRAQYGGLKADDVRRLKELEAENTRLKRIGADKELQIEALKELGRGKLVSPAHRRRAVEHLQRVFGVSPAVGMPAGRAAPQHPTLPTRRVGPGSGPASRAAAAEPDPSTLGLSSSARPAAPGRLAGQPQGHPAALARGGPASAGPAPQAPAARHLRLPGRSAGR